MSRRQEIRTAESLYVPKYKGERLSARRLLLEIEKQCALPLGWEYAGAPLYTELLVKKCAKAPDRRAVARARLCEITGDVEAHLGELSYNAREYCDLLARVKTPRGKTRRVGLKALVPNIEPRAVRRAKDRASFPAPKGLAERGAGKTMANMRLAKTAERRAKRNAIGYSRGL